MASSTANVRAIAGRRTPSMSVYVGTAHEGARANAGGDIEKAGIGTVGHRRPDGAARGPGLNQHRLFVCRFQGCPSHPVARRSWVGGTQCRRPPHDAPYVGPRVIKELTFSCGYGSAALRERLYCNLEDPDRPMSGYCGLYRLTPSAALRERLYCNRSGRPQPPRAMGMLHGASSMSAAWYSPRSPVNLAPVMRT
jgi:hypothetical protein